MQSATVEPVDEFDERTGVETEAVVVKGRERVVVSASDSVPLETRICTVKCASGERSIDEWTGIPVEALSALAEFPGGTTHLRLEATDFEAEISIRAALGGILAFERSGGRDDERTGLPRFVADDVAGERLVKRVRRITAVALAPDEEPIVG